MPKLAHPLGGLVVIARKEMIRVKTIGNGNFLCYKTFDLNFEIDISDISGLFI